MVDVAVLWLLLLRASGSCNGQLWHCAFQSPSSADKEPQSYEGGVVLQRYRLDHYLYVKWGCMVVFSGYDEQAGYDDVVVVKVAIETSGPEYDQMINEHSLLTNALHGCPGVPTVQGWGYATCTRFPDAPTQARVLVQTPLGRPLYKLDPELNRMDADYRREIVWGIGETLFAILQEIHARGIIHRDLKPDNIIVAPDDSLTIIDFGMSIAVGAEQEHAVGTRSYCAPSITCLERPATFETDVISLVYTLMAMEYGCAWWLNCEDRRDEYQFGPCNRRLPANDSAAGLLLGRYLGDPSPDERQARWDQWHIEVGKGYETEALARAHDKEQRRFERQRAEQEEAERQESETKQKTEQEEAERREAEAKDVSEAKRKAEQEETAKRETEAKRRQVEAMAKAAETRRKQQAAQETMEQRALKRQGRNLFLLAMVGLCAASLWGRNRR